MKKGFTLIELAVVIAVIGVLLGIVTTVASSSIRQGRVRKAESLCRLVEAGLATYYAQKGVWPGRIGQQIDNDSLSGGSNNLGGNGQTDRDQYVLSAAEAKDAIYEIVNETVNEHNPMLDVSGLFVSANPGEQPRSQLKKHGATGMDFDEARRQGSHRSAISLSSMYYGYPDATTGRFRSFVLVYSFPADQMRVTLRKD